MERGRRRTGRGGGGVNLSSTFELRLHRSVYTLCLTQNKYPRSFCRMGPCLLMDKSAVQALPKRLLSVLSRHYHLNIPPILITEILGDLIKKGPHGGPTWM